jgi:lipoprotein-anchoring transpeptidase ErfK/SrfK
LFATAKSPTVNAYESAADTAKVIKDFTGLTEYQQPWTFRITEQPGNGWLHVLLPMRPNDTLGWIKESDVTVGQTAFSIKVEKGAHKVTLYNAGKVVLETQVVTGKDQTPTPEGTFFITDPVDLQSRPTGAYGAYALGLSAYSEVLMSFNGGPGQIALHGTAHAEQVGQNLSNGCVRIPNDIVLKIVQTLSQPDPAVPADPAKLLGIPVDIVA